MMLANHEPADIDIDGLVNPIHVEPGQFITGRYSLHKLYYRRKKLKQKSPLTLWRWLENLANTQNLVIKTNNKYSLITILNWSKYQGYAVDNEQQHEQQMNIKRTTDEQQMNTNKNEKNEKNEKNDKNTYSKLVQEFFDYFCLKVNRKLKSTTDRRNLIIKKIKEGYTIDQLKTAADNFSQSEFHQEHTEFQDFIY